MPQAQSVCGLRTGIDFDKNQHRWLKCPRSFAVHEVAMGDLRLENHAGFLDLRELPKDSGPLPNLLFPTSLVDLQTTPRADRRDWTFLREVRNLIAADFILDESALACELLNGLLVGRVGSQPQGMPDRFVVVVYYRLGRDAGRRRALKTTTASYDK